MPTTLVYHHLDENIADNISPFDKAIVSIVTGQDIKIACPYLSVDYLQRIFFLCKTWKILADVEEWINSHHKEKRNELVDFICKNSEQIRHIEKLHAKVISTNSSALTGSANFTLSGIQKRTEMSVLFEEEPQVLEINNWFDYLWKQASPLIIEEIYEYKNSIKDLGFPELQASKKITSNFKNIQSELTEIDIPVELTAEDILLLTNTQEERSIFQEEPSDFLVGENKSYPLSTPNYKDSVHEFYVKPNQKKRFFHFKTNYPPNNNFFNLVTYQDYPKCIKTKAFLTTKYCDECTFYSLSECPILAEPSVVSDIKTLFGQEKQKKREYAEHKKIMVDLIYEEIKNFDKPIHYMELTKILAKQHPRLRLKSRQILRTMNWYPEKFERVEKGLYKVVT